MKNKQPRNLARLAMSDDESWTLRLYGVVGDDWDGFTDDSVADLLAGVKPGGTVHLNTPGGTIYQGLAVYNQLKDKKPKSVRVDGLAASMGSIIALAGERTEMTKGSLMMIHNPWNIAIGDSAELRKTADILDKFKQSLLDIYEAKTGQDRELLAEMMDEETWLSADEAVEWGFADAVIDDEADLEAVNLTPLADTQNMPDRVKSVMLAQSNRNQRTPADPVVTSAAAAAFPSTQEVKPMSDAPAKPAAAEESVVNQEALNKAEEAGRNAERQRAQSIRTMVANAKLDDDFAQKLIDKGVSEAEAKSAVQHLADYLAKSAPEAIKPVNGGIEITRDEADTRISAVVKALSHRSDPRVQIAGDDPARKYVGMRLPELARAICVANNVRVDGLSAQRIAQAALTTSDFPMITESLIGKSLRDAYDLQGRSFTAFSRQVSMPDFKDRSVVQLGEAPNLELVQEGAEYTYGPMTDAAEKYRLFKYGRMVNITWEALINDDLSAFTRIPQAMGAQAAQKEADVFYAHMTGNPAMHDGVNLFDAAHGNLAGAGAALSVASLGAARAAMRKQTGVDGKTRINVFPEFLLVPAAIETDALQLMAPIQAAQAENANPYAGQLQVIAESRLDDNSATAWYAIARPGVIDTFEYGYLEGEVGPQIETEEGFSVDGLRVKVRHSFAAKAIDWRGIFKNPGA